MLILESASGICPTSHVDCATSYELVAVSIPAAT